MENFGSAIFGLAKLKKKVTQETTERKKKKMRMMVCLVELFSQCTFMYKTTTSRNLIFGFETCPNTVDNKMEKIVQFRESALNLPRPACC